MAAPAGAETGPSGQARASTTASLALAGRPHQATERSWQAAQTWSHVTTWSQQATVSAAPATAPVVEGRITVYPDPAGYDPIGIIKGSDGALWYTNAELSSIGRITAAGKITHYTDPRLTRPFGIAAGPDGALWFTNGSDPGSIGRITTSGTVTEFTYPGSYGPKDITAGPDRSMWFINGSIGSSVYPSSIERITMGGVVTDFVNSGFGALGSDYLGGGGGMVEGPDGALWFIDYGSPTATDISVVGRMTAGGALTTYVTPGRDVPANEIASGPGNTLWFTMGVRGIGRVSTLAFTSGPKLSRPSQVGKVVTCQFGGLNASASTVAWLLNGAVLKGATGRNFTPTAADLGKELSCAVTLTNAGGSLTKKSATAKIALGAPLKVVNKPTLSGPRKAGKPESASTGTWAPGASSYSYQWYLGSGAIAHATSDRYTPPTKDRGKTLHCVVTAHRPGYANGRYATASVTLS